MFQLRRSTIKCLAFFEMEHTIPLNHRLSRITNHKYLYRVWYFLMPQMTRVHTTCTDSLTIESGFYIS
jgi:hypothetical protein